MSGCGNCGGDCSHCSGCGASLTLNEGEIYVLQELGQLAFLPVARAADATDPLWCLDGELTAREYSLILQCLEKKGLIVIDYDMPLKGFDGYGNHPLKGSAGLTLRGQQVLEMLEIQGILE